MAQPSLARDFFDRIRNAEDPVTFLRGLINSSPLTFETDWLDFKGEVASSHKDKRQRDNKLKTIWSQALGGFANNQGGVLVWGIDARKRTNSHGSEVDAAVEERPMDDPVGLKSRLTELQRGATDSPLANVEIVPYEPADTPGKGFVVCFVPEGPFKPYRSEQADQQWYIRAGDNFVIMTPSMLRTMFYPRLQARFRAIARLEWEPLDHQETGGRHIARLTCVVDIVNEGTATAKDTFVLVRPTIHGNLGRPDWQSGRWINSLFDSGDVEFEATRPLHPRRVTDLFRVMWEVEAGVLLGYQNRVLPCCHGPMFDLIVYCENQEHQAIHINFTDSDWLLSPARQAVLDVKPLW
jgi:hypothetical protein